jgi:hypothetical protein
MPAGGVREAFIHHRVHPAQNWLALIDKALAFPYESVYLLRSNALHPAPQRHEGHAGERGVLHLQQANYLSGPEGPAL